MRRNPQAEHIWVLHPDLQPTNLQTDEVFTASWQCSECKNQKASFQSRTWGKLITRYFYPDGKPYVNANLPGCGRIKSLRPLNATPVSELQYPPIGKGPQMDVQFGARQLAHWLFKKHNTIGPVALKREMALTYISIWEQAQQTIIRKVKNDFKEDGIDVLLEPTLFTYVRQEIVDHGEILTYDKDYTPPGPGDDYTLGYPDGRDPGRAGAADQFETGANPPIDERRGKMAAGG